MLRENLDTVLKDLLEFKTSDKISCKYPGSHLNLEDNFLLDIKLPKSETPFHDQFLDTIYATELYNFTVADEYRYTLSDKDKKQIVNRIRRYLDKKSREMMKPISKIKYKFRKYMSQNPKLKKERIKRFTNKSEKETKKKVFRRKFIIKSKQIRFGRRLMAFSTKYKRRRGRETTVTKPQTTSKTVTTPKIVTTQKTPTTPKLLVQKDTADGDAAMKARYLFKSCMNYEILQKRGHQPLLDLLDLLGGWPILKPAWNATKFNWLELMAKLRLYNNDILISEWVGPDIKNSDEFVIQFDQTSLGELLYRYITFLK